MKNILVTGGAGFVGSHTCLELLSAGYAITVVDNLSNARPESLQRIQEMSGRGLTFHKVDLRHQAALEEVFRSTPFEAVIHFAAFKSVSESTYQPLMYYHNNIIASLTLFQVMTQFSVKNLVFSSSCTIYGNAETLPIREDCPPAPICPYGRSKWMTEQMLHDLHAADPAWNIILLRYFNGAGAHPSGKIGEDPLGIPSYLLPYLAQVAVGRLAELSIFGGDYPTKDGTAIRDYIHVVDLAHGHLKALEKLNSQPGVAAYNLAANRGYTVLEVVKAFEKACGRPIPYRIVGRRPGDAAVVYADASLANRELDWKAERSIDDICQDMWNWQSQNPQGYR